MTEVILCSVDVSDGACDGEHDGGEALGAGPGRLYDPHGAGERGRLPTGGRQRHTRRARMYVTQWSVHTGVFVLRLLLETLDF